MPHKRYKSTGYSASTLVKRLDAISNELLDMASDGRLPEDQAHQIRVHVLTAATIARYRRAQKP